MIQITIWQWLLVLKRQIYIILAFSAILDQENSRGGLGTINTRGTVQYWIRITPFWIPLLTHVIQTNVPEMSLFRFGFSRHSGWRKRGCERGFSVMGKIKSDWRSCLSVEVLDCFMRIRNDGRSLILNLDWIFDSQVDLGWGIPFLTTKVKQCRETVRCLRS